MKSFPQRIEHEGVEGLRAGRYDIGINTSCIVYRVGETLIDTGPPNQWRVIREFLGEREVKRVLITHHHEDHSGNSARLRSEMDAVVYVPRQGLELMHRGFPLQPYRRLIWGVPGWVEMQVSQDETALEGGLRLVTIPAPGHSPDSTCYLEPQKGWLFTGDLYIASRPRFMRVDEDVHAQIESLRRVAELEFTTLFCSHRGVVEGGPDAIRAKLDYLVSLRDEVRHLAGQGRSVREITGRLLGRENFLSFITLFHFSKRNLVRGCLDAPDGAFQA